MAPKAVQCGNAGAEIQGVDITKLSNEETAFIKEQLAQRGVVFFRDQELSVADHQTFAERFGPISQNRFFARVEDAPQVAEVRKERHQLFNIGAGFHTDHSYDVEPAMGSILVARELPQKGGDTIFVDMYRAYETLPEDLKRKLEGLNAVHSSRHVFGPQGSAQGLGDGRLGAADEEEALEGVLHPVVLTHPDSGRKVLFVNPAFTLHFEGTTREESAPLLERLYLHAVQPQHLHRFKWKPGSVAFWDNRSTWHCALNDYQGQRRVMHRITLGGTSISNLNDPERLAAKGGLQVDLGDMYNPYDDLNRALVQQALAQGEAGEAEEEPQGPPASRL